MRLYFSLFLWSYSAVSLAGVLLIFYYLSGGTLDIIYWFKAPLLLSVACAFAFHLKYRLKILGITLLFGIAGFLALGIGALRGTLFSVEALTHLYMTATPIVAASLGFYFSRYDQSFAMGLVRRALAFIFIVSALSLAAYYVLHYVTGQISYFGFDSNLPIVSALLLADARYAGYVFCLVLVLLSGKRAPLVSMLSPAFLLVAQSFLKPTVRRTGSLLALAVFAGGAIFWAYEQELLDRFKPVLEIDVSDEERFYVATSGRSVEFLGLVHHFQESPLLLLSGTGIGGTFEIDSTFRGEVIQRNQHYLHMALLTYLLTFGLPFVLLLLTYIASIFWRNRRNAGGFYYLGMLITLVGSAFGAGLIVEPIFWFLLGANVGQCRSRNGNVTLGVN